nr:hypothetical protein [Aliivibrio finisterrensis]
MPNFKTDHSNQNMFVPILWLSQRLSTVYSSTSVHEKSPGKQQAAWMC